MNPQRLQPSYQRERAGRVHVFDAGTMPWEDTARPGPDDENDPHRRRARRVPRPDPLRSLRSQRRPSASGRGVELHPRGRPHRLSRAGAAAPDGNQLPRLDPRRDGLRAERAGLQARGPGDVPEERAADLSGIHAGSTYEDFRNPAPEVAPEINVDVDRVVPIETGIAGMRRQPVYDYAGSGLVRRMLQWQLRPETTVPAWQASDWVELWVRGGELIVNDTKAYANCFVVIEPGATVRMSSPFGAIALVWAEGPRGNRRQRRQPARLLARASALVRPRRRRAAS